jgi:hypothetical protein
VWEILKQEGLDPAPERASITWADFLRSQADALPAADFFETITLNGQRQYILTVIEHATRRVRVLGTTAHPSASWVTQAMKNLVMDLDDAGCRARFLLRDRDGKFPALMDAILAEAGTKTVLTGIRMPRMNSIMERWVQSCRHELLDRCLVWNERHLRHALREYERFYNQHRAHRALNQAAPLRPAPDAITDPERITDLNIRRRDQLGGVLHVLTCPLDLHGWNFRQAQASGQPPIRLHDLRHGAATLALAAHTDLKVVQAMLGHASIVLTADTYVSVLPEVAHQAARETARLVLEAAFALGRPLGG